ncbi:Protein fam49a [Physocladia obscura]|uniref:Protein fam49a n=1 Tax=Physocladia obscura TaxID=109957 RepID=A0AAD5X7F4_9FUNG|nr:Protein fam49a [Physocladia obscura]
MGQLLCLPEPEVTQAPPPKVSVDLQEDVLPTGEETLVFKTLAAALASAAANIDAIKAYTGCSDAIRTATSSPSLEAENAVWRRLTPAIAQLYTFYNYSLQLNDAFQKTLHFFALSPDAIADSLERHQATAKKAADILFFAHKFDELKMLNTDCQNDLAHYRRSLQKTRLVGGGGGPRQLISDEIANSMSMFFAQPAPMLSGIISACKLMSIKGSSRDSNAKTLSLLAAIRTYVKLIQANGGPLTLTLMNGLRFSTAHLNDENTPANIKDYVNDV